MLRRGPIGFWPLYTVAVAKNPTKERGGNAGVQRITTVDNPDGGTPVAFIAMLGAILVAGIVGVFFFANNRESNIDIAPVAALDHWHVAYLINDCGIDLPAGQGFEDPDGVHTHGDGLLHLHPTNPSASGRNTTLGKYFEGSGGELTDEYLVAGTNEFFATRLDEANGCDGEPAELKLAVWDNAFDETASPRVITENLADFRFTPGMAITLALVPEGGEVPTVPVERITALAETGPGGEIAGVEPGESPFVTTTPPEVVDDGTDADAETDGETETETDGEDGAGAADPAEGDAEDDGAADAESEDG